MNELCVDESIRRLKNKENMLFASHSMLDDTQTVKVADDLNHVNVAYEFPIQLIVGAGNSPIIITQ